ncbi:hypothetical protein GCM10009127_10730 [Alteraurantiacibacter aestuarii]|uniref:Metalloregulator ArsR/SmtB family transcription factor n=1 Tax=Alteraurantiacibacter aestuarii TaxID=650004 RepID=A0A844ZKA8_9SPHN|nr:metalloregulator ArsR/SmtB family transcription factor [Alteraurantiacibacter aestuarii]MXO87460.1 metalloregulator ArsR/SmtB family transcription factor [Alteraurantiacibacter aestuarii]
MSEAPIEAFKALGHPVRYRILAALAGGERNVGEIEEASGIGQPALSQQLAVLRKADLVTTRREAKQVYYALELEQLAQVQQAIAILAPQDGGAPANPASPHKRRSGAAVFARLGR